MSRFLAHTAVPSTAAIEMLLAAAARHAEALDVRVNIAIVDSGGNMCGFLRMPRAYLSSIEMAVDKAFCAMSFGLSTREFGALLDGAPQPVRDGMLRRPRLTEVPGGTPIRLGDAILGAIGVSGASDQQDEDICHAALAAIKEADA